MRVDIEENPDPWLLRLLKIQWDLDDSNFFVIPKEGLIDYAGINQIVNHPEFKAKRFQPRPPVKPVSFPEQGKRWAVFITAQVYRRIRHLLSLGG